MAVLLHSVVSAGFENVSQTAKKKMSKSAHLLIKLSQRKEEFSFFLKPAKLARSAGFDNNCKVFQALASKGGKFYRF